MKGSYILLIELARSKTIRFGGRHQACFKRGHYAYVGSAMNGLEARVNRHLRRNKRLHWHIDYLLEEAPVTGAILVPSEEKVECAIARAFQEHLDSVAGFGSSDCRCPAHLFFATNEARIKAIIARSLKLLALRGKKLTAVPALQTQAGS